MEEGFWFQLDETALAPLQLALPEILSNSSPNQTPPSLGESPETKPIESSGLIPPTPSQQPRITCNEVASAQSSPKLSVKVEVECNVCGKRFSCKPVLRRHTRKLHGSILMSGHQEAVIVCEWPGCSKRFSQSSSMRRHVRTTHENQRKYKCAMCSASFSASWVLEDHRNACQDKRPHQCTTCKKCFRQQSTLRRHAKSCKGTTSVTLTSESPVPMFLPPETSESTQPTSMDGNPSTIISDSFVFQEIFPVQDFVFRMPDEPSSLPPESCPYDVIADFMSLDFRPEFD